MEMMDAIVYLCGGINGLNDADCRDWREVAKALLLVDTLDPMRRDYRGKENDNVSDIVDGDCEDIGYSDFILVNATRPSWGTAMEVVYAFNAEKHIIAFTGDSRVSPWLTYHCNAVVNTVEEAVEHINNIVRVDTLVTESKKNVVSVRKKLLNNFSVSKNPYCESCHSLDKGTPTLSFEGLDWCPSCADNMHDFTKAEWAIIKSKTVDYKPARKPRKKTVRV